MAVCRLRHGQGAFWGDSVGRNPTPRGEMGSKRSVLVDRNGGPLSVVVAGANVHDTKLLEMTLKSVFVERPDGGDRQPQHLCPDKGYGNPTGHRAVAAHGYRGHIRRIGEEKLDAKGEKRYPARRWVVKRTLAWRLSNALEADFCVDALKEALGQGQPEVFNTDRGSQFTSLEFTQVLQEHGVKISMDGKGRYNDNIFVKRLWRTVKYEEVYLKAYAYTSEARRELGTYFRFYNDQRLLKPWATGPRLRRSTK